MFQVQKYGHRLEVDEVQKILSEPCWVQQVPLDKEKEVEDEDIDDEDDDENWDDDDDDDDSVMFSIKGHKTKADMSFKNGPKKREVKKEEDDDFNEDNLFSFSPKEVAEEKTDNPEVKSETMSEEDILKLLSDDTEDKSSSDSIRDSLNEGLAESDLAPELSLNIDKTTLADHNNIPPTKMKLNLNSTATNNTKKPDKIKFKLNGDT